MRAGVWSSWGIVPGGVTYSLEPLDQARMLGLSLHLLIEAAVEFDVPIRFLSFPRFVQDPGHVYDTLAPFLPSGMDRADFLERVKDVASPDHVRVGQELAAIPLADPGYAASDMLDALPTLEALDAIALRREESGCASASITRLRCRAVPGRGRAIAGRHPARGAGERAAGERGAARTA